MGIFDTTPPKRVTPTELHKHVMGQLKTGDHQLSVNQANRFREVVEGYMDSDSFAHKNSPGLTGQELPGLISNLKADQKGDHGNHLSDNQIGKIAHVLKNYIDKSVTS